MGAHLKIFNNKACRLVPTTVVHSHIYGTRNHMDLCLKGSSNLRMCGSQMDRNIAQILLFLDLLIFYLGIWTYTCTLYFLNYRVLLTHISHAVLLYQVKTMDLFYPWYTSRNTTLTWQGARKSTSFVSFSPSGIIGTLLTKLGKGNKGFSSVRQTCTHIMLIY